MGLCDVCGGNNTIVTTRLTMAKWPLAKVCNDCGASVGCHADTDEPLGKMAKSNTRYLRYLTHLAFDKIWKSGCMPREKAYSWIAVQLGLQEFHISECTNNQLLSVIRISEEYCRSKGERNLRNEGKQKNARTRRPFQRIAKRNAVYAAKRKSNRPTARQRNRRNNRPKPNLLD